MSNLWLPDSFVQSQQRLQEQLERSARFKAYYEQHCCCPQCGNANVRTTCIGYGVSEGANDINKATCETRKCHWVGIVHDMVPRKESPNGT